MAFLTKVLTAGYRLTTSTSMAMKNVNSSWVFNCHETACFCEQGPDDRFEHVAIVLHTFHIIDRTTAQTYSCQ